MRGTQSLELDPDSGSLASDSSDSDCDGVSKDSSSEKPVSTSLSGVGGSLSLITMVTESKMSEGKVLSYLRLIDCKKNDINARLMIDPAVLPFDKEVSLLCRC